MMADPVETTQAAGLRGVRKRLRAERGAALAQLDAQIGEGPSDSPGLSPKTAPQLAALLSLRDRVRNFHSAPIWLGSAGQAIAIAAIPISTWSAKAFSEFLWPHLVS